MERRETEPTREHLSRTPPNPSSPLSLSLSRRRRHPRRPIPASFGRAQHAPELPIVRACVPCGQIRRSRAPPSPPRLGFGRLPQTSPGSTTTDDGEPEVDESGTGRHDVDGDNGSRGAPPWDVTPPGRWTSFSPTMQRPHGVSLPAPETLSGDHGEADAGRVLGHVGQEGDPDECVDTCCLLGK